MKNVTTLGAVVLLSFAAEASAQGCAAIGYGSAVTNQGQINTRLGGKRILAVGPGGDWKEDHCSNGNLFKVGVSPTDPVDPRAYRGTWQIAGTGNARLVQYNYTVGGPGLTYTWALWENASGDLCWENPTGGALIATAPAPANIPGGLSCAAP